MFGCSSHIMFSERFWQAFPRVRIRTIWHGQSQCRRQAQEVHVNILKSHGCMDPDAVLEVRSPSPSGDVLE
eukprot:728093-Karenia_brevis.AAC.1